LIGLLNAENKLNLSSWVIDQKDVEKGTFFSTFKFLNLFSKVENLNKKSQKKKLGEKKLQKIFLQNLFTKHLIEKKNAMVSISFREKKFLLFRQIFKNLKISL